MATPESSFGIPEDNKKERTIEKQIGNTKSFRVVVLPRTYRSAWLDVTTFRTSGSEVPGGATIGPKQIDLTRKIYTVPPKIRSVFTDAIWRRAFVNGFSRVKSIYDPHGKHPMTTHMTHVIDT